MHHLDPGRAGSHKIARGEIARPGVYGPESLIDPISFLDELERDWNIHIDAHEP